ncbi:hypothetical protein BH23BAC4_BH23BAC4_05760 [soil metagenome]
MAETPTRRREPFWIAATAVVVMIVGARLIRAYSGFGYNVFTQPFDLFLFLGDLAIHIAIYFSVFMALSAVWRRTRSEGPPAASPQT